MIRYLRTTLQRAATVTQRARAVTLLLGAVLALATPAWAQAPASTGVASGAATATKIEAIPPADIPARADVDEQFIQAVLRRTHVSEATKRLEQSLAEQSAAVHQLTRQSASIDLASFPELRLKSLWRYWMLHDRELAQWRGELQRATKLSSDDAAGLAMRRATWEASRAGASDSSSALLQRANEIIREIDRAETLLSKPLGKLIELGRKGSTLWTQVQAGVTATRDRVVEFDRQLGFVDAAPLWLAGAEAGSLEPVLQEFTQSLEVEAAFRRAYDAANALVLRAFAVAALLLLPLLLWLRRRAARVVGAGDGVEASGALARPWAAWLVLVALGMVLYDWRGPTLRPQVVMLLAWVPVLRLLPAGVLARVGPWAYLSAVFYFLILLASLLIGNSFWYRCLLLGIDVLMLSVVGWMAIRARAAAPDADRPATTRALRTLMVIVLAVLLVAAGANLLGNVSLASMLTTALLNSHYMALAIIAGARVVVALLRVASSTAAQSRQREVGRHSGSMLRAAATVGRTLLVVAWLVYALQAFRIYQPLLDWSTSVLTHQFTAGELSVSLGGIAVLFGAGWLAFWLARTIRLVLSDEVLPSLSLPRGVDNTISTLSYYTVLFLGLMAALAAAGFKVGQLTLVLSALSVGVGFGLQDIVKNFVAGLILMFERPVQPGDLVDVAGVSGTVRDIGMRATTLRTADGADVVVPNGKLLADTLVNWTLSGTRRRFDISVSTAHSAPPQRTIELLTGIAGGFNDICTTPAPVAVLTALTPGALEFSLRVWTDRKDWGNLRSDLAVGLHDGLAKAGIEMPAP